MTDSPVFRPGMEVWHVLHGKVMLEAAKYGIYKMYARSNSMGYDWRWVHEDGKQHSRDTGRVLYTLEEARQYGWLKADPLIAEFETSVTTWKDDCGGGSVYIPFAKENNWHGKRVKVRVEEIVE